MKTTSQPIFLVEDNSLYASTLEKYLQSHLNSRSKIRTFLNGEDCIKNLGLNPKIVVVDYFLNSSSPEAMNGLDLLKRIKISNPETTVLMLSSQDDMLVATETMKYGAFDYVSKNENAFLRIENAINNIEKIISQSIQIKINRQIKLILITWIVILIAVTVVLQLFFPHLMNRI